MNTTLLKETDYLISLRIAGIDRSIVNAIRRIILSDIPVVVLLSEPIQESLCVITKNTTSMHNEIIKSRLSCIPVHSKDLAELPGNYELLLQEENKSDEKVYVTTEHFRIRNLKTHEFLDPAAIFPRNKQTNMFIDMLILRPAVSDCTQGQAIMLTCGFGIRRAKDNQCYNVACKCLSVDTLDKTKADEAFLAIQSEWNKGDKMTKEQQDFEKKNFYLLDAMRYTIPNSFDFTVESVGIHEPRELITKACAILQNRFVDLLEMVEQDRLAIFHADATTPNAFDIILPKEDYTLGNILNWSFFLLFFATEESPEKQLNFVAFRKRHPDDEDSFLRIAFHQKETATVEVVKDLFKRSIFHVEAILRELHHHLTT